MDRGRNLEALAEEDGEEEMEDERHRDSDSDGSSSSDDDAPDTGTRRGEPNKFDILCDGVNNSMALVHTALEELLDMKDEMLKHSLPPTLLIKLATNTGKVFRSISDLNMPINELIRLVRVYSTPWEEKSAALKKLHEDYEAKQRQLNIAIKRLQLVDAHSKRIAKEKRVMNWEKLFAKMMSNKGHGRRWKFLIETIKQKAKLGLEHVQEFTRALDESSDEEDDEMPRIELKSQQRDSSATPSEKISEGDTENELEEGEEEEEAGGEPDEQGESDERSEVSSATKEVPSIKIGMEDDEEEEEEEEEITGAGSESSKKVRFATAASSAISTPKVETRDAEVWTDAPEYDQFLFVRMYAPVSMVQTDIKCSVTFGKQFYKSKRLDGEGGVDRMDGKTPTSDMLREKKASEIKRGRYEEAKFTMADWVPEGVWQGDGPRDEGPNNCQITIHSGPMEEIIAMATIDIADLHELDLKRVFLPEPHGDDDVPKSPEPDIDNDTDSLSSDVDIPLPDDDAKVKEEPHVDYVKDVEPMMFPLYSLDSSSTTHKPCGNLPLIIYWGNRLRCTTFNRQTGTYGVSDLVFEMTGIDLDSTTKEDLNKQMVEQSLSAIGFVPDVQDRALSAMRLTPIELEPPQPPSSPESEVISEHISPEFKEKPAEELVPKYELDRVVEKHSKDMLFLQEEYEKRLQGLLLSIQSLEESKAFHQQQLLQQQQQLQEQQRKLSKRSADLRKTADRQQTLSPAVTSAPPATPANIIGPDSEEVSRPIIHAPMPPQKPKKGSRSRPTFVPKPQQQWQGVPEDFLERLQYFEEESYRHKQDLLDKTKQEIQADIEKKLAGQHKLSRKEEELYEALNDVSLPALFMPFSRGTLFNPRAHQYFHATGSSELRLTQPPSVFQLPPLHKNKSSILNLFELSKNFNTRGPGWLMDRYIQQQEPVQNTHGMAPLTSMATSQLRSPPFTPEPTFDMPSVKGESRKRVLEQEAEC